MKSLMAEPVADMEMEDAGGWGDDDDVIADTEAKATAIDASGDGEGGWDVEDADLEIPDLGPTETVATDNYVHLPTKGVSSTLTWTKNSQLVADHVVAGSFETAARLLHDQVGVVNFKPYEALFTQLYSSSRTVSTWQGNLLPTFSYPLRNWKESGPKGGLPSEGVKLNDLVSKLQVNNL